MTRLHPAVGIVVGAGLLVLVTAAPGGLAGAACAAALSGGWVLLRGAPRGALWKATVGAAVFFGWAVVGLCLTRLAFPVLVADIGESLRRTASLALRSFGALWAIWGAAGPADPGELLAAAGQLGLPARVISLLFIAHHHVFVYLVRVRTVRMAMAARLAGKRVAPIAAARAATAMLVRAAEQADALALSLVARGFDGALPTRRIQPLPWPQFFAAVAVLALAAALLWAAAAWIEWL